MQRHANDDVQTKKKEHHDLCRELSKVQEEYAVLDRNDVQLQEGLKHCKQKRSKIKAKLKKVSLSAISFSFCFFLLTSATGGEEAGDESRRN